MPRHLVCRSVLRVYNGSPTEADLAQKTVVCVITGHGLKDPETALTVQAEMTDVPDDLDAVERAMALD